VRAITQCVRPLRLSTSNADWVALRLSAVQADATETFTDMSWLPPRKLAARRKWFSARPWLAGCYFGVVTFVFFVVVSALYGRARSGLAFGLIVVPPFSLLVAILTRFRIGEGFSERHDADEQPLPTYKRRWSRVSDRYLAWMLIIGLVVGVGTTISLALPSRSLPDLIPAIAGISMAAEAAAERRLRRRST
jgi:hypothetical protein